MACGGDALCDAVVVQLAHRKVHPEPMDVWPIWMRDLWLGPVGRDHGEEGLKRQCARKYSRQLNCALSLASQVRAAD